eukprot:1635305-Pyramimonas_sp.AAC.1
MSCSPPQMLRKYLLGWTSKSYQVKSRFWLMLPRGNARTSSRSADFSDLQNACPSELCSSAW